MRSKQQPRPSYRWHNKEENEEGEEAADSPENKDNTRSESASPPSPSASIHSPDSTPLAALIPQIVSHKLDSTVDQNDESRSVTVNNLPQVAVFTTVASAAHVTSAAVEALASCGAGSPSQRGMPNASFAGYEPSNTKSSTVARNESPSMAAHETHAREPFRNSPPTISGLQNFSTNISTSSLEHLQNQCNSINMTTNRIDSRQSSANCSPAASIKDHSIERELASPRCQSRDSSSGGRCPSDDSNYSGNGSTTAPTAHSPVGITLPATLPPAAAAALLPPQSAAMAAYLNVAAAAAQQNRLLLGNPLAAAAGLVRAAQSPPTLPLASPIGDDSPALDFSTKRVRRDSDTDSKSDSDAVNLSKSDNGPLDLSVGSRKRGADNDVPPPTRKLSRQTDYKPVVSPWPSPITPYFAAAVAAASLSPKNNLPVDWNGKSKMAPSDATKALEKMSEMTRLSGPGGPGAGGENDHGSRQSNSQTNQSNASSSGGSGRHSAWQSHWLNKGADAVKDVFKCVWCKQSFPTLATLTTHMKETQHCGVNVPPSGNMPGSGNQQQHHHHHHQSQSSGSANSSSNKSDLNLLIKETMPLPRKLVRGQDVWLGKGAEQTRQILKCMWCGQSFRSLAEMTSHMQQTQHYTNIISQEQIISWKSSEDGKGGGPSGPNSGNGAAANTNAGANSTVSAVLTCKVCDQAFSSLKDLSNHMVKNAHYKEHIMRSITESGGRRRQTREKRKKSLPVRKLLELERAQHEFKNGEMKPMREIVSPRITCDKCGDKIETALFVEHIRQCVGGSIPNSPRGMMKSSMSANSIIPPDSMSPLTPNSRDGRKSIGDESASPASNRHISPLAPDIASPSPKDGGAGGNSGGVGSNAGGTSGGGGSSSGSDKMSSPSVLNAIEQLIEKSFDTRSRHGNSGYSANSHTSAPLGSSILKRLGIDESVDYTKPLIDPQTMSLLRTYQQHQYSRRERSGSESSSVSDRGSSRLESLTPERKPDISMSNHATPRQSPDKSTMSHQSEHEDENKDAIVKVKKEPIDDDGSEQELDQSDKVQVKKECEEASQKENDTGELDLSAKRKASTPSSPMPPSPNQTTLQPSSVATSTPAASPCSDRSITPRSTSNSVTEKKISSGSLNALSSMFDSLTGTNSTSATSSESNSNSHMSSKKGSSHPLAALQKLCDKTENTAPNSRSGSANTLAPNVPPNANTASGAILAFSWACNDAVMTSDSIIKCAFCDTPFCSKGAYRHHLSKVHFVKDDVIIDPIAIKAATAGGGGSSTNIGNGSNAMGHGQQKQLQPTNLSHNSSQSPKGSTSHNSNASNIHSSSASGNGPSASSIASTKSPPPNVSSSSSASTSSVASTSAAASAASSSFEESPHSKFLKYTELAKQLSSKYV